MKTTINLKKAYQEKIEQLFYQWNTQLELYSAKIDHLKQKADSIELSAKLNYLEKLKDLEMKIANARSKLEESRDKYEKLMEASDEAWDDLKSGGQMAWEDLRGGIESAWDDLKIAFDSASAKLDNKDDA